MLVVAVIAGLGAVTTTILAAALSVYVPRQVRQNLVANELAFDRRTLARVLDAVPVPPTNAHERRHVDRLVRSSVLGGDYVRIKLWSPSGVVLASDQRQLVGQSFAMEPPLAAAFAGRAHNGVGTLDPVENRFEQGIADRLMEVYLPVVRNGRVVAVWEIYRSLDRVDAELSAVRRSVRATVAAAVGAFVVFLAFAAVALLRVQRQRSQETVALSRRLAGLLDVSRAAGAHLDASAVIDVSVATIRSVGGFDAVALVDRSNPGRSTVAGHCADGELPECLRRAEPGTQILPNCASIVVPVTSWPYVLAACRSGARSVGDEDAVFLSASAEILGNALENARLYEVVAADRREQQRLTHRLVTMQEEERRRIASDIHDGAGQQLHRVLFGLRAIRAQAPPALRPLARRETEQLESAIRSLRRLQRELLPSTLEDIGLVPALRTLVDSVAEEGVRVDASFDGVVDPPLPVRLALYRVAQEALHNVVKHAHVDHARLELSRTHDGIEMVVRDDGHAVTPPDPGGLGVSLMHERAAAVGGRLSWSSTDEGTTVRMHIPVGAES